MYQTQYTNHTHTRKPAKPQQAHPRLDPSPLILGLQHLLQHPTLALIIFHPLLTRLQLAQQPPNPRRQLARLPRQAGQQIQLGLKLIDTGRLDLDELARDGEVETRLEDVVVRQQAEGSLVDGFAGPDGVRAAVAGDDGDEFGLLESLQRGFAAGLVDVGEEDLVVAQDVGGGEGFDQEPGLLGTPFALALVDVEDVHFEDLGGALFDDLPDGFCGGSLSVVLFRESIG